MSRHDAGASSSARAAPYFVRAVFLGIVLLSVGNFQQALTGAGESDALQQAVVLVAWLSIILVSYMPGACPNPPTLNGLLWPALFYGYAIASAAWSGAPEVGLQKSGALLITTFAVWRLVSFMKPRQFFNLLYLGLLILIVASILVVRFAPHIGVLTTWQHNGQWSGLFVSKQLLGSAAAFLVALSLLRLSGAKRVVDMLALLAGLACLVGSGSRGAAIVAIAAAVGVILARRSRMAASAVAHLPLVALALAAWTMAHLASSGRDYIQILGSRVDFTERTLIWQYGLSNWLAHPTLGFGLNGFWSDPVLYYGFQKKHGWVLDNFHSGYNTILIELGLFGLILFGLVTYKLCRRISRLSQSGGGFEAEAMLSFLVLYFIINLTETFLLRSTSAFQVTLTYILFSQLARPRFILPRWSWLPLQGPGLRCLPASPRAGPLS